MINVHALSLSVASTVGNPRYLATEINDALDAIMVISTQWPANKRQDFFNCLKHQTGKLPPDRLSDLALAISVSIMYAQTMGTNRSP
jgi:hypothetical protein